MHLYTSGGVVVLADDAYYYFIVARNLFEFGESSALQGVPTNGYHPIWLILLTFFGKIFGFSLIAVRLLEIALFVGASIILVLGLNIRKFSFALFLVLGLYHVCTKVAFNGMETSLLILTASAFAVVLLKTAHATDKASVFLLFLTAGLTIGTRLDAAFFVLPAILLVPRALQVRLTTIASLAGAGAIYVATNILLFDSSTPISGRIKSLGDFGINELYVSQLSQFINSGLPMAFASANWVITPWVLCVIALVLLVLVRALPFFEHKNQTEIGFESEQRALVAILIGCVFFFSHLLFNSSWRIWSWYGYPSIFLVIFGFALFYRAFGGLDLTRWAMRAAIAITVIGIAPNWVKPSSTNYFYSLNRLAVNQLSAAIDEQPIAMGDRAGSLGWHMGTGLYQLEGLVNSTEYYEMLKTTKELRPLLCSSGVRYIFDYEPDLGQYDENQVSVFRTELTSFEGPVITVKSNEQIAVFNHQDLGIAKPDWVPDPNLYVWRLAC